jgi:hypothetical protein
MRLNSKLQELAAKLMGMDKVFPTLDTSEVLAPGQGKTEKLHVDACKSKGFKPEENPFQQEPLRGRFCAVPTSRICVPGSHEGFEQVQVLYEDHAPRTKGSKFTLNPDKEDPMGMFTAARRIDIPAGCMVFWHPHLFHADEKNEFDKKGLGRYRFGFNLGYQANLERECYKGSDISELQDRLHCKMTGDAPSFWPDGRPVHSYPETWKSAENVEFLKFWDSFRSAYGRNYILGIEEEHGTWKRAMAWVPHFSQETEYDKLPENFDSFMGKRPTPEQATEAAMLPWKDLRMLRVKRSKNNQASLEHPGKETDFENFPVLLPFMEKEYVEAGGGVGTAH